MKRSLFLLLTLFLVSCSGTGTKSISVISSIIDLGGKGKVIVSREKGYYGSGQLYTIILNGKQLGKLGQGETLVGASIEGTNNIEANVGGYDLGSSAVSFKGGINSNNYFIISFKQGLLYGSIRLIETNESSWKNAMQ